MTAPQPATPVDDTYWYEHRRELEPGQIFRLADGSIVMLDKTVPGDGTKWYVVDRFNGHWSYEGSTIEPGELRSMPLDGVPK